MPPAESQAVLPLQGWAVSALSLSSALLSLLCLGGLAVCIVLTFANRGRALLAMCTFADMELIQIAHECPFDPTRIYVSLLRGSQGLQGKGRGWSEPGWSLGESGCSGAKWQVL